MQVDNSLPCMPAAEALKWVCVFRSICGKSRCRRDLMITKRQQHLAHTGLLHAVLTATMSCKRSARGTAHHLRARQRIHGTCLLNRCTTPSHLLIPSNLSAPAPGAAPARPLRCCVCCARPCASCARAAPATPPARCCPPAHPRPPTAPARRSACPIMTDSSAPAAGRPTVIPNNRDRVQMSSFQRIAPAAAHGTAVDRRPAAPPGCSPPFPRATPCGRAPPARPLRRAGPWRAYAA